MSTNNSIENIICRTKGSGEEQRERERQRTRINWGRMSEEDRQRSALGKEKGDEIIANNADNQKESGLEKTDEIVAKNAEKPKDSVLWQTDRIVAKNYS